MSQKDSQVSRRGFVCINSAVSSNGNAVNNSQDTLDWGEVNDLIKRAQNGETIYRNSTVSISPDDVVSGSRRRHTGETGSKKKKHTKRKPSAKSVLIIGSSVTETGERPKQLTKKEAESDEYKAFGDYIESVKKNGGRIIINSNVGGIRPDEDVVIVNNKQIWPPSD